MPGDPRLPETLSHLLGEPVTLAPLPGATSSDLFLVQSASRKLVLRLFKAERWELPAATLVERESSILATLVDTALPTPVPEAKLPAEGGVIMSWLPGEVLLPRNPDPDWLNELARTLAGIHRLSVEVPFGYESWNDMRRQPAPEWWQDAGLWDAAQRFASEPPDYQPVFVHRDFHPVNLLWQDGRVSGIVDWINACMGPLGIDVAHCRLNLALMYGIAAAEAFLDAYVRHCPDYGHNPFWDLDDALGALPNVAPYPPWAVFGLTGLTTTMMQHRIEQFIGSAVRRLQAI